MKNPEIEFLNFLKFKGGKLTESSEEKIDNEAQKNNFQGYFKWQNWREPEIINLFKPREFIYIIECVENKYLKRLSDETKLDLYRILLAFKMENNDCQQGLKIISSLEDKYTKDLFILNVKGNLFRILGWYKDALESFYDILESLKNEENLSLKKDWETKTNYNIAIVYAEEENYQESINIFKKHLKVQKKHGNKLSISRCYSNLAHVYSLKKDFKQAIKYNSKAEKLKEELGDKIGSEKIKMNITSMYIDSGDIAMAEKYLSLCKNSDNDQVLEESIILELRFLLQKLKCVKHINDLEKKKLFNLAEKNLESLKNEEAASVKITNYEYIAEAFKLSGNYLQAIEILDKRFKLYNENVERQKSKTHEQIRTNHEFHLQQKELEKTEMLLRQKEDLNLKLKRLNDELEQFNYMASHDLKSPLRTILAICALVKEDDLPKEERDNYLELIKSDALKINKLVTALLEYSKIGYTNVTMKELELSELMNNVVKNLKTESNYKKAKITLEALPSIKGNEILLEQLFQNILGNALKYNNKKKPEIIVRKAQNGNGIEIIDNGIGIPNHKTQTVFKAFTRAHSASKYEGSGVGLAMCKKIMDIHSGTISVSSEEEKGSCFTLNFSE